MTLPRHKGSRAHHICAGQAVFAVRPATIPWVTAKKLWAAARAPHCALTEVYIEP
jgi:hypothetical protein